MGAAAAAAAFVLTLSGGTLGQPTILHRADPDTLRAERTAVRLPGSAFGLVSARRGSTLAIVAKPTGGFGFPIRLVQLSQGRVAGTVAVGKRDICGLTFRGSTLVAFAADQACYWNGGTFAILRIDVAARRVVSVTAVRGLHRVVPASLAFGGNDAFLTHAGGGVDAVDLTTGVATAHQPRRALAKGEEIVPAHWLGGGLLGAGPRVVNVRTWRARVLEAGARGVVRAGGDLVAYGARGAAVYTRGGRFLFRPVTTPVYAVTASGRHLYAGPDIVDLRTHRVRPSEAAAALVLGP